MKVASVWFIQYWFPVTRVCINVKCKFGVFGMIHLLEQGKDWLRVVCLPLPAVVRIVNYYSVYLKSPFARVIYLEVARILPSSRAEAQGAAVELGAGNQSTCFGQVTSCSQLFFAASIKLFIGVPRVDLRAEVRLTVRLTLLCSSAVLTPHLVLRQCRQTMKLRRRIAMTNGSPV